MLIGTGLLLVAFAYVTSNHYLQIEWNTGVPVPVLWGPLGLAAGVAGVPLLFAGAGLSAGRAPHRSWPVLLLRVGAPCLALHTVAVVGTAWVLRRFSSSFAPVALYEPAEIRAALLLPPPELAVPYTLAVAAVVGRLTSGLPRNVVIVAAAVLAVTCAAFAPQSVGSVAAAVLYFVLGRRILTAGPHLGWAVPAGGAAVSLAVLVLAGPPIAPLLTLLAGLAAIPPGVLCVRAMRSWNPLRAIGTVPVVAGAALVPAMAIVNHVALPRLSLTSGGVQALLAMAGPILLSLGFVAGAMLIQRATTLTGRTA
ncbi:MULTISPECIES: hypothetical protein [Catenuloplanes]|uniref:Uncharacterized protein n=1 Tax=Catenuloplanes niger TaxID=587534 RepID=A0AAE3ZK36_9ACTN|nr:hypothetical protein [Catenuloplanes niger]MDR7320671.1 hypothetical protein [Catenuloplanes niger]